MIEEKKVNLVKSLEVCAEISNLLLDLENTINLKKKEISERNAAQKGVLLHKNQEIEALKKSSNQALASMEKIISKLNRVLEKDGSGNNNN